MTRERLTEPEILAALETLPSWRRDGDTLRRAFELRDFRAALAFANRVGMLAEERDHHPDILIFRWNHVEFSLTTHSAEGLTSRDVDLARAIDALATKDGHTD